MDSGASDCIQETLGSYELKIIVLSINYRLLELLLKSFPIYLVMWVISRLFSWTVKSECKKSSVIQHGFECPE